MQLYTCCPDDGCGASQKALNWLKSHGIEPALEFDGEHHYFEFHVPDDWETARKIEFRWKLAHMTSGVVFCRCERWLDEEATGQCHKFTCRSCGRDYLICRECDALEEWGGCDCGSCEQ